MAQTASNLASGNASVSCTAGPGVARLALGYRTEGPNQLACSEGTDVPYPITAPGYIEDPTGWSKRQVCCLATTFCLNSLLLKSTAPHDGTNRLAHTWQDSVLSIRGRIGSLCQDQMQAPGLYA